ncbi:MAG: PHP-associated domain-containing protein [Lachnospira sp.]
MKFDMHCHTDEGSTDAKVSVIQYARTLKRMGFSGMLVTDHDSYDGYRAWKSAKKDSELKDFIVLKGIEYDTIDAGHMIVIMPEDVKLRILELRGLSIYMLMDIVHRNGGILGPAHPCGEKYLSIFNTGVFKYRKSIARNFDFVEGFNACEDKESNVNARKIAKKYGLPVFGGSDAHKEDCIGLGYTRFMEPIRTESELIEYIKSGKRIKCGGIRYLGTIKDRIGNMNYLLVQMFWFYNKIGSITKHRKRLLELKKLKK